MPPATVVGTSIGVQVGTVITFPIPIRTQPGDQLIAVISCAPGTITNILANAGEDNAQMLLPLGFVDTAPGTLADTWLPRFIYTSAIGATLTVKTTGTATWSLCALLVVRGLTDAQNVGFLMQRTNVSASTNFSAPTITLAAFSDFYLGAVTVTTAATAVTPPSGAREHIEIQASARTLSVFSFLAEATGATGGKVSTTAGSQSGVAASIAYPVASTVPAAELKSDAPGAIGFVDIGV